MNLSFVVLLIAILSLAALSNGSNLPKTLSEKREEVKGKMESKEKTTELQTKKYLLTEQMENKKLREHEKKKEEEETAEKNSGEKETEEKADVEEKKEKEKSKGPPKKKAKEESNTKQKKEFKEAKEAAEESLNISKETVDKIKEDLEKHKVDLEIAKKIKPLKCGDATASAAQKRTALPIVQKLKSATGGGATRTYFNGAQSNTNTPDDEAKDITPENKDAVVGNSGSPAGSGYPEP
eukprot:g5597.t1